MQKAVIYDMDGLLVDSEPIWQEAEINIFKDLGVHLTRDMCFETKGLRIDEVVQYWYYRQPWANYNLIQVTNDIMDEVIRLFGVKGELLPGAAKSIETAKSENYHLAVASSSYMRVIKGVLDKFDLRSEMDIVWSAQYESHGKPHPAIYMTTAQMLGVNPENCIALEDSIHGVVAAIAARMKVIAVPDKKDVGEPKFGVATATISSLEEITPTLLASL